MKVLKKDLVVALSMGDPAGISPEIVASNLPQLAEAGACVFGHWPSLEQAMARMAVKVPVEQQDSPGRVNDGSVRFVHCGPEGPPIDAPSEAAAVAQFAALDAAVDYCLEGEGTALVTAPVAKEWVAKVSPGFTGHTEYLARRAGLKRDQVTMVFAGETLAVGLVSTHIPMRLVASVMTPSRLKRTIEHVAQILKVKGHTRPRIGLAALNPHAGENGLLGAEEEEILIPLCQEYASREDLVLKGPIPADSLFREALAGQWDGVVSIYHDQAMIPLKLGGVGQTVNVTMGLPFVRTSPDHGTAYDIAGKGLANPAGLKSALELAVKLSA